MGSSGFCTLMDFHLSCGVSDRGYIYRIAPPAQTNAISTWCRFTSSGRHRPSRYDTAHSFLPIPMYKSIITKKLGRASQVSIYAYSVHTTKNSPKGVSCSLLTQRSPFTLYHKKIAPGGAKSDDFDKYA